MQWTTPLQPIAVFRLVGYSAWNGEAVSSSLACYTLLFPGGVMVTSHTLTVKFSVQI